MKYICLIYSNENESPKPGTPEFGQLIQEYEVFSKEVSEAGVMLGGEGLNPVATATTVSVREREIKITDGPFAETKEQLGGYYVLDCKDLDEAIAYAAKIPSAKIGRVEVRPVMNYD